MSTKRDILNEINHNSGMTVPDGYFDRFADDMISTLPYRADIENPSAVILPAPSVWSRIRPYVYLAAMFAGIWCMLKMFTLMSSPADSGLPFDNNPVLAEAIGNDAFIYDYVIDDVNQWDLYDEMIDSGIETSSFYIEPDSDEEYSFIDPAVIKN